MSAVVYVFNVERGGRIIDEHVTPTRDVGRATEEAIDLLGLPADVVLVLRTERSVEP